MESSSQSMASSQAFGIQPGQGFPRWRLDLEHQSLAYSAGFHQSCIGKSHHSLLRPKQGVLFVETDAGEWCVPQQCGIWIPADEWFHLRAPLQVQLQELRIDRRLCLDMPCISMAVGISTLADSLLKALKPSIGAYLPNSRDGHMAALLLEELHRLVPQPLLLPAAADERVALACEHIRVSPRHNSTAQGCADLLGVSERTLHRLFKRATGLTYPDWRKQAMLHRAIEWRASGMLFKEIAAKLGYDSPSAFSHMIRKTLGSAPTRLFEGI